MQKRREFVKLRAGGPDKKIPYQGGNVFACLAVSRGDTNLVCVIQSFADKETEKIFRGDFSRKLAHDMQRTALKRLMQLDAATALADLAALPGLRLETLRGDRKGQHSVRVNQQWRVCFEWTADNHATEVEITDYH